MKGNACRALFSGLDPFLSIGICDVADLCVEFLYMWVRRGREVESVSFDNESFGDFCDVRYHVSEVTLEDVVFCGRV